MDVSVIIVNYNTCKMTSECIDSVIEKTHGIDYEIILIDNASTDGSKDFFEKDSRIKYIYSEKNLGFGKANNLGYRYSCGKYLFLLNSDTLLLNNALKIFFDFAEKSKPNELFFGTVLVDKSYYPIHSCANFPTFSFIIKKYLNNYTKLIGINIINKHYDTLPKTYPSEVDYITGADLFIKKFIIDDSYGLFNHNFFMYYEETELQYRYSVKGFKSIILNGPQIIHLCGKSTKRRSLFGWICEIEGSLVYSKLIFPRFKFLLLKLISWILLSPIVMLYPSKVDYKILWLKILSKKFKVDNQNI